MPFIPPPYPPTRRCPCGVNVSLRFVMATNARNAGRPYYACSSCRNWYRWGDGLGNSPRNSPTTSPTIDQGGCPPAPAPSLPVVGNAESGDHCRSAQCTVKRVGRKCQRRMCRKHCRAAGGCLAEGHSATDSRASATTPNAMPNSNPTLYVLPSSSSSIGQPSSAESAESLMSNIDPALRLLSPPPSSIHPSLSSIHQALAAPRDDKELPSQPHFTMADASINPRHSSALSADLSSNAPPSLPLSSAPPRIHMADASINPRHASQLRPIFVEHVANVHERAEKKRQRDQELVQEKKRMCERVIAFSFSKNDDDPVTVDFQHGFVYPYFKLNRAVLVDLELICEGETVTPPAVHFFDPALDTWVKMKIDSVIELTKPAQKLFFKALHVTSYPRFDYHFHSAATYKPNIRHSLSQERTCLKQTQTIAKSWQQDTLDALLELSSDEDCNDPLSAVSPKKCRTEPDQPPLSSQLLRHDPAFSRDLQSRHTLHDNDADVISIPDDDSVVIIDPAQTPVTTACLIPGINPTDAKFPSSFYAVDVHTGFSFRVKNKVTVERQFEQFFGVRWKSSTYYDHKSRWYNAPRDARDRMIAAGYSDAGRYSVFLDAHPAKDAELKAAKRKLRASQPN